MSLFPCYGDGGSSSSSSSSLRGEKRVRSGEELEEREEEGRDDKLHYEKRHKKEKVRKEKGGKIKKEKDRDRDRDKKKNEKKGKKEKGKKEKKKDKSKSSSSSSSSSSDGRSLMVQKEFSRSGSSSSDLDTSSDEDSRKQLQVMNSVASSFGCEPVFLPNGQIVIKEKRNHAGNLDYQIDRAGDRDLLVVSTYRLDIPKYTLVTGVSSAHLARKQDTLRITSGSSHRENSDQEKVSTRADRYCNLKRKEVSSLFKTNVGILRFEEVRKKRHEKEKTQERALRSVVFDTTHLQSLFGSNQEILPLPIHVDIDKMIAGGDNLYIKTDAEMHSSHLRIFNQTVGSLRDASDWKAVVAAQPHIVRHQLHSLGSAQERRLREQRISHFDQRVLERSINFIQESLSTKVGNSSSSNRNAAELCDLSEHYCHLLMLLEAIESEEKVANIYSEATVNCGAEVVFVRHHLQFLFKLFSPNSLATNRSKYEEISSSFTNRIQNEIAAEQMMMTVDDDDACHRVLSRQSYCEMSEVELLSDYLDMELNYGCTERVVAIIQAVIEFNSSNCNSSKKAEDNDKDEAECWDLQDFSEYWDSEYARVGDVEREDGKFGKELGFQKWRNSSRPSDGWIQGGFAYSLPDFSIGERVEHVKFKFDMRMYHHEQQHAVEGNENDTTVYGNGASEYRGVGRAVTTSVGGKGLKNEEIFNDEERSGWVYSIVHGRRIDMTERESSVNLYRRILSEMAGEREYVDDDDQYNNKSSHRQKLAVISKQHERVELISTDDLVTTNWMRERNRSLYDFRPLRATIEQDEALIEQAPERVILYSDISSSIIELGSSSEVRFLFVTRALELLGVIIPLSNRQNSIIRQDLNPFLGALDAFVDSKHCFTTQKAVVTEYIFQGGSPSTCHPQHRPMYFSEHVIKSHNCTDVDNSINSRMTFIIRLMEGIIDNGFVGDDSKNIELTCGLISLQTHQHLVHSGKRASLAASLRESVRSIAQKYTAVPLDLTSSDVRAWHACVCTEVAIGEADEAATLCDRTLITFCGNLTRDNGFKRLMSVQGAIDLVLIRLQMILKLSIFDGSAYPHVEILPPEHDNVLMEIQGKDETEKPNPFNCIDEAIEYLYVIITRGAMANNNVDAYRRRLSPENRRCQLQEVGKILQEECDALLRKVTTDINYKKGTKDRHKTTTNSSPPVLHSLVLLMGYVALIQDLLWSGDENSVENVFDSVIQFLRNSIMSSISSKTTSSSTSEEQGQVQEVSSSLSYLLEGNGFFVREYVKLLEMIYCSKVNLLSARSQLLTRVGISVKNVIIEAAIRGVLRDFPLNREMLVMYLYLNLNTVAGHFKMRDYFVAIEDREYWGGGSQPIEKLLRLLIEILFHEQRFSQMATTNNAGTTISTHSSSTCGNDNDNRNYDGEAEKNKDRSALEIELHCKLISMIENSMEDPRCRAIPIVWRLYINSCLYLASTHESESVYLSTAKKAFYRGLRHCAGNKSYLVSSIISLRSAGLLSAAETNQILDVMHKRGHTLRSINVS